MCGIIGYSGTKPAAGVLLDGLKRLEYRGYDSAGIALLDNDWLDVRRAAGKLNVLCDKVKDDPPKGRLGIGHTRWATHGRPTDNNAHPHVAGNIAVIHNGIIENHAELRKSLQAKGRRFLSDTDTEVVAHLIDEEVKGNRDYLDAIRRALARLKGSFAFLIINRQIPDVMVAARRESPLICGIGDKEFFFASDVPAFLQHTNRVIFLEDNEMAVIQSGDISIMDFHGRPIERPPVTIDWSPAMSEKSGYDHFMLKEIHEQPRAVADTCRGRIESGSPDISLDEIGISESELARIRRVVICGCGTSYHAGLVAKFMFESLARVPVEVDLASEMRYRDLLIGPETLVLPISQSGETLDTLVALRAAKTTGAKILSICNVLGSSITRESDGVLFTYAGPEIGVASTKAFTTQLTALYILALHLGRIKKVLPRERAGELIDDLLKLPDILAESLEMEMEVKQIAARFADASNFLYLGRGLNYPIALEGALKLKEISYIHAEGYPAGEMKHGPIALVSPEMPVVALVPRDKTREKIMSNIEEVKARDGLIIAFGQEDDNTLREKTDAFLGLPQTSPFLNPILFTVPLQLLAYHVAVIRGTDVDQPRNLAKSVTVE